jgi:hypothetical protein
MVGISRQPLHDHGALEIRAYLAGNARPNQHAHRDAHLLSNTDLDAQRTYPISDTFSNGLFSLSNSLMTVSSMTFPKAQWRLVQTPPASGAWNMAVDEAILETAGRQLAPPTLRLYAWSPPCLSLGFAQPASDVDFQALQSRSWDIVRRPTGGRSILHTDELTYSVSGPYSEPRLAGSVLESYQRISAALLEALRLLSIPAQAQPELARLEASRTNQKAPARTVRYALKCLLATRSP